MMCHCQQDLANWYDNGVFNWQNSISEATDTALVKEMETHLCKQPGHVMSWVQQQLAPGLVLDLVGPAAKACEYLQYFWDLKLKQEALQGIMLECQVQQRTTH